MSDNIASSNIEFQRPPLAEVVIGLEFDPISSLGLIALARLQSMWGDEFPTTHEVEALAPSRPANQGPAFEVFFGESPGTRLWSISGDEHSLVQTQRDRLLFNWRRLADERGTYPGFDAVRSMFTQSLEKYRALVEDELRAELKPLVVEWTYINHIEAEGPLGKSVFHVWRDPDEGLVGDVVQSRFQHVRAWQNDGVNGQLEISGEPMGFGPDAPLQLTITCKFFMSGPANLDEALAYCAEAHQIARNAFETITTADAQAAWGGEQ